MEQDVFDPQSDIGYSGCRVHSKHFDDSGSIQDTSTVIIIFWISLEHYILSRSVFATLTMFRISGTYVCQAGTCLLKNTNTQLELFQETL